MGTKNIKRRCAGCDNLLTGRSDKKFCTAKCKSSHHNARKRAGQYLSTTDGVEGLKTDVMPDLGKLVDIRRFTQPDGSIMVINSYLKDGYINDKIAVFKTDVGSIKIWGDWTTGDEWKFDKPT